MIFFYKNVSLLRRLLCIISAFIIDCTVLHCSASTVDYQCFNCGLHYLAWTRPHPPPCWTWTRPRPAQWWAWTCARPPHIEAGRDCVHHYYYFSSNTRYLYKKYYYLYSKYFFNSKYSYQNIIICVLNIIIFFIIQCMKADPSAHVGLRLHQNSTILGFCSYKT